MDLLIAKLLSGLVLWITSLIFGLAIPFFMRKKSRKTDPNGHESLENEDLLPGEEERIDENENLNLSSHPSHSSPPNTWSCFKKCMDAICRYDLTSAINCLCGGLFLGICFLELLPECRVGIDNVFALAKIKTKLPVTEFVICSGLLLVMLVEQLVSNVCAQKHKAQNRDYDVIVERPDRMAAPNLVVSSTNSPLPERRGIEGRSVPAATRSSVESFQNGDAASSSKELMKVQSSSLYPTAVRIVNASCSSDDDDATVQDNADATRTVVLIAMLSLHSIFEGLALGLETTVNNLVQLFVAIVVHKCVLAFSLGLKLFDTFSTGRVLVAVVCMGIFSTGSPLGCAIGTVMSLPSINTTSSGTSTLATTTPAAIFFFEQSLASVPATQVASAILECLATGTFLYVTFVEVIPLEFKHEPDNNFLSHSLSEQQTGKVAIKPLVKLVVLFCGFAIVSGLQFV